MAKHSEVVRGYAENMFGMAALEDSVETLEDQLFELNKGIAASPKLRDFLADAGIPAAEKKKALGEILTPSASPLIRSYTNILIDTGKAGLISDVAEAFIKLVQESKNQVLAEVTSAIPLTQDLTDHLSAELGKTTGKKVNVKNVVDTSILGGLVIKMENKIIDLSLQRKLDDLQNSLHASLS
ncbi:MAG: ATP synthase F1 subunit delta [Actinomycetota bacterium]